MSKLVDTLRQVGSLHASGEFTLDVQQADSKMSRFQFAQEQDFLYQLVGGLYRLGARQVDVTYAHDLLTIALDPLAVPDAYPKELAGQVLEEFSRWRRLAAACQAILAHAPRGFEWRGKNKQAYDCLTGQTLHWQRVHLQEIQIGGLPDALVQQALAELRWRAVYHRLRLTVQGNVLPGLTDALARVGDKHGFFGCDPTRPAQLLLVVDEMISDPKPLAVEIPWQGVVYWDQQRVRMDASLAAVVEDEDYAGLLGAIPQTFARCLLELRPLCGRGEIRRFLLDLMRPPAPPWLHSIYDQLLGLELFKDYQEQAWSLLKLRAHCQKTGEPAYFSEQMPPPDLSQVILREQSPSALDCLAIHLPGQLQEATPLAIRQLQRRANLHKWQTRPSTGLQLPSQDWLTQRKCDDLVIGVSDDWCQPGGTISLLHQGKLLGHRSLPHPEVAFGVVCELEQEHISELWDDIAEPRWLPLSSIIFGHLEELLADMAANPDSLSPLRTHLLGHLAASDNPQDSYFATTLLFRDWMGQPYSIFSLLKAKGEGYLVGLVAPDRRPPAAPPEFLPKAVFVLDGMSEGRCLTKVKELSLRDFDAWLDDLVEAIESPQPADLDSPWTVSWEGEDYRAQLRLNPLWDQAEVHVCIEGIPIETHTLECELGFTAIVHSDSFKLQIRTGNKRLGLKRYALADNAPWRHCQEDLSRQAEVSLGLRVDNLADLPKPWPAWALNAVLRGFAVKFPKLADFVSFSAFPQDISLAAMLAAPSIRWSSRKPDEAALTEFLAQHPYVFLVAPMPVARQQLLEAAYGGNWTCVDEWFARNARQREFLRRPVKPLGHPKALATAPAQEPLSGMLLVLDDVSQAGLIAWHHQQRPLMEEPLSSCPALLAQLECDQLQPDPDFTSLVPTQTLAQLRPLVMQQLTELVKTWLATPRPAQAHFCRVWTEWQALSPEVAQGLQRQPWIATNRGYRSWEDLLEVATLYRLPRHPDQDFPDLTILLEDQCPMGVLYRLVAAHPQWVSVKDTRLFIADRVRWQKQQANLRSHAKRVARFDYKARLRPPNQGEIALLGEARKECWLVLSEHAVLVHNLPAGLGGYLQCDDHTLLPVTGAELGELAHHHVLLDALPLFVQRIMMGNLSPLELDLVAEFCLHALPANSDEGPWNQLLQARWLPCADGTRTSLHQLQLEAEEQGALLYWERAYRFGSQSALIPLLTSPLQLEVVRRCCGVQPTLRPKPLLLRNLGDVARPGLSRLRQLIVGLGQWVAARPGARLAQGVGEIIEQSAPAGGGDLVAALGRLARLMLQGVARNETLSYLDRLAWCGDARPAVMWSLSAEGGLTLFFRHPRLRPWLGHGEPPAPVTLSLLLGLVCHINARSEAFSDDMERDFLEHLTGELVASYRDLMPG
ncbi:hypothetical protein IV102_11230 [bacterium]|nr:hypothetical protein [bacterium]